MTLDQLIAEVSAQPTRVAAFSTLMECLRIEMNDAMNGDSPTPSLKSKYDSVFSGATGKANEILNAIENGKPALDPVRFVPASASDPGGPVSPAARPDVFRDRPIPAPPIVTATGSALPIQNTTNPPFATNTTNTAVHNTVFTTTATSFVSPPFAPNTTNVTNAPVV